MAKRKDDIRVPNLRFPGFEGDWITKKFVEVGVFFKGTGISKDKLTENGNPCILYGELYTKYKNEVIKEVFSKTDINPKGLVSSKANDIIIPSSGESAVDIATACCVNMNDVLLGGDLNVIRPYKDNGNFISYQLNGKRKLEIAKIAQGSSVTHLYNGSLQKLKINLPSNINEQDKIASLLSIIDDRIATQNKIIQQLETLMLGLSDMLFGQKLRFKNDKGETFSEWEEKTLGEIADIQSGSSPSNFQLVNHGLFPFIKVEELNNNNKYQLQSREYTNNGKNVLPAKSIIFPKRGAAILTNKVRINQIEVQMDSNMMALIPKKHMCNYEFLYYLISRIALYKIADTSSIPQINNKHVLPYKILLPSILEQTQIANLLYRIDENLKVERNLLKQHGLQKKYLLRNMFI